jgi:ABC-2 type transport system permease protein
MKTSKTVSKTLTIARKEATEVVRDGRFRWLAAAVLVLMLGALVTGWQEVRAARRAIDAARAAERAVWLDQGEKNPHSAAHFGRWAFKPAPALAYVDRGVDSFLGSAVWLEAHWQDPFGLRPAEDRTAVHRFGELTAAWTLQYAVPLLIVLVAFAAFAGERDRGTLRQLASLGVSPRALAFGKALGLAAALAAVLVPAVAVGAAVLVLGFPGAGAADTARRGLVLAGAYLVYFAAILAVALAVSARARTARTALVVLLGFWIASNLLVPRLAADLAERLHPSPTPRAFYAAIARADEQGLDGHGPPEERQAALERRVLEQYRVASLEELPVNFAGISLQASEEFSNLVFDREFGGLWRTYERQEAVHRWAALASPLLAVRALSMALAGTDVGHHRHFADAGERHRRVLVAYLNDDMTRNAGDEDFGYLAGPELWSRAPAFTYTPPGLAWALRRSAGAAALLAAWLGAAALAAALGARRLRPV